MDADNSDVEESEQDDIKQVLTEMKKLIKMQPCSKASKFCKIIRESAEFSKENLSDDEGDANELEGDSDDESYESLKNEVLSILKR